MKPIRETCVPRAEVLKGDLEDAVFAADFGHVVEGRAPKVYQDPEEFFRNTHPAARLTEVVTTIFERLANPHEAGAAVPLSTGFGGGKTHTLIALWHLAKNITRTTLGTELLPAAGRPSKVAVAGIDARPYGSEVCGIHGELKTHSLWAEMAYQLRGEAGYQRIRGMDQPTNVPDAATIRAMLPDGPTLILLDELVEYMAKLREDQQKPLLAFLSSLIAEIGARPQAVVVITDTAGQPVWQEEAEKLKKMQADQRLAEVLGRKASGFDPIGDETPQVIIRRLFERVDTAAAQEVAVEYHNAYQRVAEEYPDLLPPEAASPDYANRRIVLCYPFHPRLLETVQERLGAIQDFQKSRGVLRLFGRILRDTWDSHSDVCLISAGDLDWTSQRIQADLLHRIRKDPFKAAVDADVVRHAGQLDRDYSTDIHRRVASALLLESLPLNPNAAMDKRDLTLATLRPGEVGNEPGEAIDRLISVCWHTYRANAGKFQFRYAPNAIKIVEERMASVSPEDAKQDVLTLAQGYFGGHTFSLVAWPSGPKAVQDTARLKLVLCESEALAQEVCDYQDDSDPVAKEPRRFRNAVFGVAPAVGRPLRLRQGTSAVLGDGLQHGRDVLHGRPRNDQVRNPHDNPRGLFGELHAVEGLSDDLLSTEHGHLGRADVADQDEIRKALAKSSHVHPNAAVYFVVAIDARAPKEVIGHRPEVAVAGKTKVATTLVEGVRDALEPWKQELAKDLGREEGTIIRGQVVAVKDVMEPILGQEPDVALTDLGLDIEISLHQVWPKERRLKPDGLLANADAGGSSHPKDVVVLQASPGLEFTSKALLARTIVRQGLLPLVQLPLQVLEGQSRLGDVIVDVALLAGRVKPEHAPVLLRTILVHKGVLVDPPGGLRFVSPVSRQNDVVPAIERQVNGILQGTLDELGMSILAVPPGHSLAPLLDTPAYVGLSPQERRGNLGREAGVHHGYLVRLLVLKCRHHPFS